MPTINQLATLSSLSTGDKLVVYSTSNGDARKASLSTLLDFISENFASPTFQNQVATPSATGFNVNVNDTADNTWLIINPVTGYAAGAITLPAVANCVDGQEIIVNCTQAVTTFTVNGNGAIDIIGEPSTLAANAYFRLRYYAASKIWYRIG